MSKFEDFFGGGALTRSAGVSFEGMPFMGSHGGVASRGHLGIGMVILKPLPNSYSQRDYASALVPITPDNNSGANISTSTVGTWATIISTTGTQGKLFNVIPNVSASANSLLEIEVTIDGAIHTYSATISNSSYTAVLGAGVTSSNLPETTGAMDLKQVQALPSSFGDTGFQDLYNVYAHILHPLRSLEAGFPYLQWTTDMQVRVRVAGTSMFLQDAAAVFMYD